MMSTDWQQPSAGAVGGGDAAKVPPPPGQSYPHSSPSPEHGTVLESYHEKEYVPWLFQFITAITRSAALLGLVGLWIGTVLIIEHRSELDEDTWVAPWYLLAMTILITFFESVWILNKCAIHIKETSCVCCCRVWRAFVWVDDWKKSVLYIAVAIPCFIEGIIVLKSIILGAVVLVIALLYFLKSFRDCRCIERQERKSQFVQVSLPHTGPLMPLRAQQIQSDGYEQPPAYSAEHYRILDETQRIEQESRQPSDGASTSYGTTSHSHRRTPSGSGTIRTYEGQSTTRSSHGTPTAGSAAANLSSSMSYRQSSFRSKGSRTSSVSSTASSTAAVTSSGGRTNDSEAVTSSRQELTNQKEVDSGNPFAEDGDDDDDVNNPFNEK